MQSDSSPAEWPRRRRTSFPPYISADKFYFQIGVHKLPEETQIHLNWILDVGLPTRSTPPEALNNREGWSRIWSTWSGLITFNVRFFARGVTHSYLIQMLPPASQTHVYQLGFVLLPVLKRSQSITLYYYFNAGARNLLFTTEIRGLFRKYADCWIAQLSKIRLVSLGSYRAAD